MSIDYGDSQFDLRTLNRSLREGKITSKEVDHYLKGLPDEAKKSEEIAVCEPPPAKRTEGSLTQTRKSSALVRKASAKAPTFAPATEV